MPLYEGTPTAKHWRSSPAPIAAGQATAHASFMVAPLDADGDAPHGNLEMNTVAFALSYNWTATSVSQTFASSFRIGLFTRHLGRDGGGDRQLGFVPGCPLRHDPLVAVELEAVPAREPALPRRGAVDLERDHDELLVAASCVGRYGVLSHDVRGRRTERLAHAARPVPWRVQRHRLGGPHHDPGVADDRHWCVGVVLPVVPHRRRLQQLLMGKPEIIAGWGSEPREWAEAAKARTRAATYEDASTIILVPTLGNLPTRVVDCLMSLMRPPNAKTTQLFTNDMPVDEAYNQLIEMILAHPELSTWRYILTIEHDNLVPPTALLDLQREMVRGKWDVLGGLYWTKGEMGVPQIWGDITDPEYNFRPVAPIPGKVVRTNGTGMGCTLYKLDVFKRMDGPWFQTVADGQGLWTQDLYAYNRWREGGVKLKVGVDCRVKVGHLDVTTNRVW
jgi:hypothetical protein